MNCPGCGRSNPESANFCSGCGKDMPKIEAAKDEMKPCPRCGHANPSHVAYCGKCGVSVMYDLAMQATDDSGKSSRRSKSVVSLSSEASVPSYTQKPMIEKLSINPDELVQELDNIWASIDLISKRLELLERRRNH